MRAVALVAALFGLGVFVTNQNFFASFGALLLAGCALMVAFPSIAHWLAGEGMRDRKPRCDSSDRKDPDRDDGAERRKAGDGPAGGVTQLILIRAWRWLHVQPVCLPVHGRAPTDVQRPSPRNNAPCKCRFPRRQ